MATVSVRYIVDDVDAAIAFYTERLGFGVEFNPFPGFAVLSRGDLRLLLNEPGAGGAGQPMPDGRNPSQAAGTASSLRLTISPARSRRCATRRRTSATRSWAAEAASRSCLRTPPATPSNFSNPQVTEPPLRVLDRGYTYFRELRKAEARRMPPSTRLGA